MKKKNMYKMFGAAAIVGLFLLSSIASTSLATISKPIAREKKLTAELEPTYEQEITQIQQIVQPAQGIQAKQKQFNPPDDEEWFNNILDNLPEVTYEMDGQYEDPAYPIPEEFGWGCDDDETLDTDPDDLMNVLDIISPNLKITNIKIHRAILTAWFTVTVRNIRAIPVALPTKTLVVVTKLCIPIHFHKHYTGPLINLGFPLLDKYEVDVHLLNIPGLGFPWSFTGGGSVLAWPDCEDRYDEGVGERLGFAGQAWDWLQDHDIRIRHFWSNLVP